MELVLLPNDCQSYQEDVDVHTTSYVVDLNFLIALIGTDI
jgi:hypothetical protein